MKMERHFDWMTLLLFGAVLLLPGCATPDYAEHIGHFASNTPPDIVRRAVRVIGKADTNAFPALLAHLDDKSPADVSFQREVMVVRPDGTSEVARPTIGNACFDLLQGQIEGNWPKGFRHYYVLSSQTIRDWLARHPGLSLRQLRLAAAQESLGRAEADTPKVGESEFHKQTLEFLRKNLEEAKRNAPAFRLPTLARSAGAREAGVSLSIISSSAQRIPFTMPTPSGDIATNEVRIFCTAVLDNQTPTSLTVTSSFYSVFDGLHLSVLDGTGRELARQSYCQHQSPASLAGLPFALPSGRTTNELWFPILGISESNQTIRARLDGTLPHSNYSGSMTSEIVLVTIEQWRPR